MKKKIEKNLYTPEYVTGALEEGAAQTCLKHDLINIPARSETVCQSSPHCFQVAPSSNTPVTYSGVQIFIFSNYLFILFIYFFISAGNHWVLKLYFSGWTSPRMHHRDNYIF